MLFSEPKERSIATVAALIGNTGNLGIPLGIALFGEESIPYTTLINLVNVFVVYTIGVFYYSRGEFSVRDSLMNILKLPVLWAAMVAIVLNLIGYVPSPAVDKTLMMGAYASMTMQLVLFGIYLYGIKLSKINLRLTVWVNGTKFILIPLIAFGVLGMVEMEPMVKGILFLELIVPLAVANVNLASLYNCSPRTVTVQVFVTSVLFLGIALVLPTLLRMYFERQRNKIPLATLAAKALKLASVEAEISNILYRSGNKTFTCFDGGPGNVRSNIEALRMFYRQKGMRCFHRFFD